MNVLEIPSMSITEVQYGLIVSDTVAHLNAFTPENGDLVPAYVRENDKNYHWTGSAWATND
jgi:hypothetical protein